MSAVSMLILQNYIHLHSLPLQFRSSWLLSLQVRRGADRADIYSISLSPNVQWLAVSSDKGTVHIFSLRVRVFGQDSSSQQSFIQGPAMFHQNSSTSLDALISPSTGANPGSSLSFMRGNKYNWPLQFICQHAVTVQRQFMYEISIKVQFI